MKRQHMAQASLLGIMHAILSETRALLEKKAKAALSWVSY